LKVQRQVWSQPKQSVRLEQMYDPNKGKFNLDEAEQALGIDEHERRLIRLVVATDLLLAHAGITDEQLSKAYAERIRNDVKDASIALKELAGDD